MCKCANDVLAIWDVKTTGEALHIGKFAYLHIKKSEYESF